MCGKVLWMFLISQRDAFISLSQKDFASLISHRKHWTNPHPPCSSNRSLGWRVENGYMHGDNPLDLGLNIHNSCHLHPFTNFSSGTAQVIHTFPAPSCWDWWDAIWIRPRAVLEMQYSKHTPNSSRMASGYHQFTFISWDKLGYGSPTTMVVSIYLVHLERWYFFCEYQEHYPFCQRMQLYYIHLYTHTPKIHKASTNQIMFFQNVS